MKRILTFFLLAALAIAVADAKTYKLSSPDGKTVIEVDAAAQIIWKVSHKGQVVLTPSVLSMSVGDREIGRNAKVKSA